MTGLPERIRAALGRVNGSSFYQVEETPPRAVVILPGHGGPEYCTERGYQLAAVAEVRAALEMVLAGHADVVVCASDADLLPVIELTDRRMRRPGASLPEPAPEVFAAVDPRHRRPEPRRSPLSASSGGAGRA